MIYRTRDGDVLDAVCLRHYGGKQDHVEAVLDANPGLADLGPVLPSGVLVTLPDIETVAVTEVPTIRLWD